MLRPAALLTAAILSIAAPASAATLRIDKLDKLPSLDGVPGEWPRQLGKLGATKGAPSAADFSGKAAVAYDDKDVYIAVDITDDTFKGGAGGDRVEVVLVVGGTTTTVTLVPGLPGKSAGKATVKGSEVKGAKVVEAPRKGGWTLEAKVPWAAFEGASSLRVGMRGGVFVHDVDSSGVDAVIGTHSSQASLPAVLTTPEQALQDGLIRDKKLSATPSFQATANVVGDGMKERVLVYDRYLVVLGPTFRKGKEYYFADMSVSGASMKVLGFELRELDGDGRHDIVFRKRFTKTGQKTSRDVMHVQSFGAGDTPELVFIHEIGIVNPKGSITNDVSFATEGAGQSITIRPGSAKGLDESSYDEPREASFDPLLLPWGTIESQTYKWKGKGFAKASEKTRSKPASSSSSSSDTAKPTPPAKAPPPAAPDTAKVYALYKKDRGITTAARFDVSGDVEGDTKIERVVVHDAKTPELAVFGPGHKKGTGYSFTTLPFASGSDVKSVSLRDATGDKKSELIIRGNLKAKGPKNEEVIREIEVVYRVSADGIKRVFAAEVGRSIGTNKIIGAIAYEPQKGTHTVLLSASKAVGFTKESYPFNQDASAIGGIEPLFLPWSEVRSARYKWAGSGFEKM